MPERARFSQDPRLQFWLGLLCHPGNTCLWTFPWTTLLKSKPPHKSFQLSQRAYELRNPVIRDMSAYADVLILDAWPAHPYIGILCGDRPEDEQAGGLPAMLR
jgi:hypothetical protein